MISYLRLMLYALLFAASAAAPGFPTQLAQPGPSGVVMGHLHLTASDAGASRTFWSALGGVPVQNGALQLLQFPGTFVMLRQGQPSGGTAGSTVDRVTFRVRDLNQASSRWQQQGIQMAQGAMTGPDGIIIRLVNDPSLDVPLRMESISIATPAPNDALSWYAKQFGAIVASGSIAAADLPGVRLEFIRAAATPAPTRGRALDHIGFEVKGLEEFCKKLEASGIKLDRPFTRLPNSMTAIAFLTDPWGTYIELTENLAPKG